MTVDDTELLLAGDYPDPSILRVGEMYYMVHSSFLYTPGLQLWSSDDMLRWTPVTHALPHGDGDVWAPELVHHGGRFFIYYHTAEVGNRVVYADAIEGPWSDPVPLDGLPGIDPGHVVDDEGRRYLHVSGGQMAPLSDDGLAITGEARKVCKPWPIPDDWAVGGLAFEGPKLLRHGGHYHLFVAEGGTGGPPTSHMVLHARAPRVDGPWEYAPDSPLLRTASRDEPWWSRGHGTVIDAGPDRGWWVVYHGYAHGFHTLGRQTLFAPVAWTDAGWLRACDGEERERRYAALGPRPAMPSRPTDAALRGPGLSWQWRCYGTHATPHRFDDGLVLEGDGGGPGRGPTLACMPSDRGYVVEVDVERLGPDAAGGLMLFYNERAFTGMLLTAGGLAMSRYGQVAPPNPRNAPTRCTLRLINDRHFIRREARADGGDWQHVGGYDASGYHHNTFGGFLSLRVALCATGQGPVRFTDFRYRALS